MFTIGALVWPVADLIRFSMVVPAKWIVLVLGNTDSCGCDNTRGVCVCALPPTKMSGFDMARGNVVVTAFVMLTMGCSVP